MQKEARQHDESEAKAGAKEGDTGDDSVYGFAETPSFLATSVSHLRSGTFRRIPRDK
jgi:hypothetical protein